MNIDEIYRNLPLDKIPWIRDFPPLCLKKTVQEEAKPTTTILDLGCGTGIYALYFKKIGFEIIGIDISPTAIKMAKQLFAKQNLKGRFYTADLCTNLNLNIKPVDFAYGYEILHHIFPKNRERFVKNVVSFLKPEGKYLSVCFSEEDRHFGGKGKFRKTPIGTELYFSSEKEIQTLMAPFFRILELKTILVPGKNEPHKAIYCLMQKE